MCLGFMPQIHVVFVCFVANVFCGVDVFIEGYLDTWVFFDELFDVGGGVVPRFRRVCIPRLPYGDGGNIIGVCIATTACRLFVF